MPTISEIERLVGDYEKKIEKLKYLENVLKDLDAKGFEKDWKYAMNFFAL